MITPELTAEVQRLRAAREPFVHATVVRAVRPTSVRPGDSALVLADGTIMGFVGGTCAQTSVRLHAARALERGEGVLLRLIPGTAPGDVEPEEGVVIAHNPCLSGGALDIFLDPQLPARRVVVVGDTPIARALAEVAGAAGYDVVAVGDAAAAEPQAGDAAVVVASHGSDEEVALTRAVTAGVGYVALVASPRRGAAVLESLDVAGALRERVHTPAGLDIGAHAPADVAISILAEIVSERVVDVPSPSGPALPVVVAVAIDPICGMEVVATDASIHLDLDGERVYFCRVACRETFVEQRAADAAR
jgi:xanthine dehydrogenase accessory factor